MKSNKNEYVRYVVKSDEFGYSHSYSCELGRQKALSFAIACADHFRTKGQVFGEKPDRTRVFVYDSQAN